MSGTGLLGTAKLNATERHCPVCDPLGERRAACGPQACQSCGSSLVVVTRYTDAPVVDRGQYFGDNERYRYPVARTTGQSIRPSQLGTFMTRGPN